MQGLHLTADLHHCQCDSAWLTDAPRLGAACLQAVQAAGLQAVGQLFHAFPPVGTTASGVTATILLAESHLCVHTWPVGQRVVRHPACERPITQSALIVGRDQCSTRCRDQSRRENRSRDQYLNQAETASLTHVLYGRKIHLSGCSVRRRARINRNVRSGT